MLLPAVRFVAENARRAVYRLVDVRALLHAQLMAARSLDALRLNGHAVVAHRVDADILLDESVDLHSVVAVIPAGDDGGHTARLPAVREAGFEVAVVEVSSLVGVGQLAERDVVIEADGCGVLDVNADVYLRIVAAVEIPYVPYPVGSVVSVPRTGFVQRCQRGRRRALRVEIVGAGAADALDPAGKAVVRVRLDGHVLMDLRPGAARDSHAVAAAVVAAFDYGAGARFAPRAEVAELKVAI